MNSNHPKRLPPAFLAGLIAALLIFSPALGFENPRESPPGTSAQTGLTASPDGTKFGIGSYNFLERFNLALGSLFQGKLINPKIKGSTTDPLPAAAKKVAVQGNYAYVALNASGGNSFKIIDVSNPANPTAITSTLNGTLPSTSATELAVSGKYMYITFQCSGPSCGNNIFRVVDISNPAFPTVLGGSSVNLPTQTPISISVSGRYAYVVFNNALFRVIDVSNPSVPTVVGSLTLAATASDVYIFGNRAYLALNNSTNNFAVVDVSNPASPIIKYQGSLGLTGMSASGVHVSGRYAYVTFSGSDPFRVVDLQYDHDGEYTTEGIPWAISGGGLGLPSGGNAVQSSGRYVYLTFSSSGSNVFRVVDVYNPAGPTVAGGGSFNPGLSSPVLAVAGRYAYLADSSGTFKVADISGLESVSSSAHSLETGSLRVFSDARVGSANIFGGLTIADSSSIQNLGGAGQAVAVGGNLRIVGTLTKNNLSFLIDHPLNPARKFLRHSMIESSEMKNIYDGTAVLDREGGVEIQLPNYFESLNRDFRYQLSPVDGTAMPNLYIAGEVKNNSFRIAGGRPFGTVSWQVTGVRNDAWARANPLKVEESK